MTYVTWKWTGWELNPRPVSHKSNALMPYTAAPPRNLHTYYIHDSIWVDNCMQVNARIKQIKKTVTVI